MFVPPFYLISPAYLRCVQVEVSGSINTSISVPNPIVTTTDEALPTQQPSSPSPPPNPIVDQTTPSSPAPPNLAATAAAHVTECATVYSILMACVSTGNTALHAYYAHTGDEKVYKFWMWIILPTSTTAMAI